MKPLTKAEIQRALINVTARERGALTTPAEFDTTEWPVLDFYGWRDPKVPHRGYLVREEGGAVVAVAVETAGALPPGRKAMCAVCRAVDNSNAVALFAARRAGAAGRAGNTVGTYVCAGLDCSQQLRIPRYRAGRARLDTDEDVDVAAAQMLERLDAFIDNVRR